ncbi:hypothetical protein N7513_006688 [Penicillium frequentans]|nr:hypothetical protein N7513_006688 [Penicillium glabrum]
MTDSNARQEWTDEYGNPVQVPLSSNRRRGIYALPVVRQVVWRNGVEEGYNTENRALLGYKQRVGIQAPFGQECDCCKSGKGPFAFCIVVVVNGVPDSRGACSNCGWNNQGVHCSHHRKATATDQPLFIQQEINRQKACQQAMQQKPQLQPQPQHQPMAPAIPYDGRYYTSPLDDAGFIQSHDLSLVQRTLESCNTIAERLKDDKAYLAKHLRDIGEPEVKDGEDTVIDSSAVRLRAPPNPHSGRFYDEKWLTSPWDDAMVCNLFDFPAHRRALLACNVIINRVEDDKRRLRLRLEEMGELND